MDWRNILTRAAWTFVQGALSVSVLDALASGSVDAIRVCAIAGLAAVLSLVKTIAQEQLAVERFG